MLLCFFETRHDFDSLFDDQLHSHQQIQADEDGIARFDLGKRFAFLRNVQLQRDEA